jgi:photosystem II stability/assembly factor-like uncharacterized protein
VGVVEYAHTLYTGGDKEPDLVFVAAHGNNGGLYRSIDAGRTWEKVFAPARGLYGFDRAADGTVMYACGDGGIWRSTDGKAWEQVFGMPFGNAVGVTVDPADAETIWIATPGGGIWRGPGKGAPDEKTDVR